MVQSMDRHAGRIVDTLEHHNLRRETLVLFLFDNGPLPLGNAGPLRGHKATIWEGGHRVPALASWPGHIDPGTTTNQLALTMDLVPTLLDLTGTEAPDSLSFDGRSLRPVLLDQDTLSGQRTVFWNWPRRGTAAVRHGRWKLVLKQPGVDTPKLFDLDADLGEQRDLADQHSGRVDRLTQRYHQWREDVTATATPQPSEKLTPPKWIQP